MYETIYGLQYAANPREAELGAVNTTFEPLVDRREYDHYSTADNGPHTTPAPEPVYTDTGEEWVDDAWESTVNTYKNGFEFVRRFLNEYDDEAMWTDQAVYEKYSFGFEKVGQWHGRGTYLYGPDGEGVRTEERLEDIRENPAKWSDFKGDTLWVVPSKVHY